MKSLRNYQKTNAELGAKILQEKGIVYLTMEVRTGKTVTALEIAKILGFDKVLFLTKKKAISSILDDYESFGYEYAITVINDESMHTVSSDFDLVIHDEHHRFGAFPKPSKAARLFKEKFDGLPMIFLSGTPHPESYSQIFHQFWVSSQSPFNQCSFYKWFKEMDFVKTTFDLGYGPVNNYSNNEESIYKFYSIAQRRIKKDQPDAENKKAQILAEQSQAIAQMHRSNAALMHILDPYMVKFTQIDAGFSASVNEVVLHCRMKPVTYDLVKRLKKDKVVRGKSEVILADTAVKCMGKIHQLCSGTIKFESGETSIIDDSKAVFIKHRFKGNKIAIFYKFQAEYKMLKGVFKDELCSDLDTFNSTSKNIALQIVSGREGISLKNADYLVYLNLDFSSLSYWQSRDRLTTIDRKSNDVFWVFSEGGIEDHIYESVIKKKDYTLSVFKKDFYNGFSVSK